MKKHIILIAALCTICTLSAQTPVNDDCSGIIDLGFAPSCSPDVYTNVNATPTDIGNDNAPTCFNSGIAHRDVWFMFTCPDTLFDFRITLTGVGNSIINPEFAVYRGDCEFDGLAELLCAKADVGENTLFLDVTGLTPGLPYFIRVSDYSQTATPNWGEFTLCVDKIPPITTIDEGGSGLCEGTLYDSGGPDNDYGPDEDYVFNICPNDPSGCITFTLEYYNIEIGVGGIFTGDALTFYDGPDINSPIISQLNDGGFTAQQAAGGGVCFTVQASSGCLTVQFTSDATNELEGWKGQWVCSSEPCVAPEQMTVNTNITADDIVDAVSTPATTVTVTSINCGDGAYGTFSFPTDNNDLGLDKGLILTSGSAQIAVGPNNQTGAGLGVAPFFPNDPGDADLDYLSVQQGNGLASNDACIVELDVFVATDELTFEYVFGSEEYPEYVNSNFNDIFAFLVSGPGIVGDPGLGGALNIATLPNSNTFVQINSVNNLLNWQYYRNNQPWSFNNNKSLQYDGLTSDSLGIKKTLTARTPVIPCNTYHLKLAVADRADEAFDSGVFVSKIQGGTPNLAVQFASGIDYFIEDCSGNQDQLVISLSQPFDQPTSFIVTVGGTATLGADYTLSIPPIITFPAGQTTLSFPIVPLPDALMEGTETITISLSNNFGCGTVVYKTLTVELADNVTVDVVGGDTLFVCAGSTLQLQAEGAANYFWAPPGAVSNPFISDPTITPTQDIWLEVTGTVSSCVDVDSVYVRIIDPEIEVVALTPTDICQGTTVLLQANNNVNNSGLVWSPAAGLDNPNSPTPVATPLATTTYTATVSIAGCSVSDQVTINVDTLFFPTLTTTDTTVCQNYPVQLANVLSSTTAYNWTPALGLDDPASSGPIALPDATTTYTLVATSANNYCSQTASVKINVIAADVEIQGDDYYEICLGDTVALNALFSPVGADVKWSPSFYLSGTTGPSVNAYPDESVTVFASYTINGCFVSDSVRIRVDSLPDQSLIREMDKEIYCPGDTVYLISPTYEPANFPDIMIEWLPFGGQETPLDNWNMVITATTTHIFERIVTNRGCKDTSSIEVPVAIPPTIMATVNPEDICPGESAQILVTVDPPGTTLEWQDMPTTLSCSDCPNPTATPMVTTTYTIAAKDVPCPSGASVTVNVLPLPLLNLPQNPVLCLGQSIQLNTISEPGVTYAWSPPTGLDNPNSATPVATPTTSTNYTLTTSGAACDIEAAVNVTVVSATIDVGPDITICANEGATLTAVTTGTPGTVTWTPGNLTGNSINVNPTVTTTYTATIAFSADCFFTDEVTITVLPIPMLDLAENTTICLGESLALNTVSEPGVTYSWSPVTGLNNPNSATPVATPTTTTTYTITASNADCTIQEPVTITVAAATLDAGPDQTICFGDGATLTAITTGTPGNVTWTPGNFLGNAFNVNPLTSTTYTATLAFGPDCVESDTVRLTVIPGVSVENITAAPDPTDTICIGVPITLKSSATPASAVLTWTIDGGTMPGITGDSVTFVPSVPEGSATFTVIATAANGCSKESAPVTYDFKRCLAVPNAFTPGSDGVNDTFGPLLFGSNTEITQFIIFNRWGQKVFESSPGKERWDGKVDGKDAPSDVYVYYIVLQYANGDVETLKGDIALLR